MVGDNARQGLLAKGSKKCSPRDTVNAPVAAGTMWQNSGTAIQLNVNPFYYSSCLDSRGGPMPHYRGFTIRVGRTPLDE
jgi:hypothetical protein